MYDKIEKYHIKSLATIIHKYPQKIFYTAL